jgi:D-glycero-alpha-D-manno-heptose-7-phosphate kinase
VFSTRTPLRVSFFGGGTDYPEYYERHPAAVLGTAIDKYVYIHAIRLERFMGFGYRLSYRINEEVEEINQIEHPVVRALYNMLEIEKGWNVSVMSSLPSRSGLGSSSSFTVGMLKLLGAIKNIQYTRFELAQTAIHVERNILKENVGVQDQLHATFGSLNRYDFNGSKFQITPVRMTSAVRDRLNNSMYLVHTGIARFASKVVQQQVDNTKSMKIDKPLSHLYKLCADAQVVLEGEDPERVVKEIGAMVDDGWQTKRSLSVDVSTPLIDELYAAAIGAGALGGKLCGAGGGGFLFLLVPPECRVQVQRALKAHELIPIHMDESGATLITP